MTEPICNLAQMYVPEELQYIDEEKELASLYTKLVCLFGDVLDGNVNPEREFTTSVDNLYEYWDVIRKPYAQKVRALLDPHDLSGLLTSSDEEVGKLMYYISNIYAIKGTMKALRYALRVVGMDAEVIRWYEPEYKKYRPEDETCYSILKIQVGDRPITDEMVHIFNRLVELLVDICTVIPVWIYVKKLEDQVDMYEGMVGAYVGMQSIRNFYADRYSPCSMEISKRGLEGILGVHAHPVRDITWLLVGRWYDPVYEQKFRHDHEFGNHICDPYHDSEIPHLSDKHEFATYVGEQENLAHLVHVVDPTIRHNGANCAGYQHDAAYKHNQYIELPLNYYQQCHDGSADYSPCDLAGGSQPFPIHSGSREPLMYFLRDGVRTPPSAAPCNREPHALSIDSVLAPESHTYTFSHNSWIDHSTQHLNTGNVVPDHRGGIYTVRGLKSIDHLVDLADPEDNIIRVSQTTAVHDNAIRDFSGAVLHDSHHDHDRRTNDHLFHNGENLGNRLSTGVTYSLQETLLLSGGLYHLDQAADAEFDAATNSISWPFLHGVPLVFHGDGLDHSTAQPHGLMYLHHQDPAVHVVPQRKVRIRVGNTLSDEVDLNDLPSIFEPLCAEALIDDANFSLDDDFTIEVREYQPGGSYVVLYAGSSEMLQGL